MIRKIKSTVELEINLSGIALETLDKSMKSRNRSLDIEEKSCNEFLNNLMLRNFPGHEDGIEVKVETITKIIDIEEKENN